MALRSRVVGMLCCNRMHFQNINATFDMLNNLSTFGSLDSLRLLKCTEAQVETPSVEHSFAMKSRPIEVLAFRNIFTYQKNLIITAFVQIFTYFNHPGEEDVYLITDNFPNLSHIEFVVCQVRVK